MYQNQQTEPSHQKSRSNNSGNREKRVISNMRVSTNDRESELIQLMTDGNDQYKLMSALFKNNAQLFDTANGGHEIGIGAAGEFVRLIQQALLKLGCINKLKDGDDAKYGTGTEKAVKQFQSSFGLKKDGIIGDKTLIRLDQEMAKLEAVRNDKISDMPIINVKDNGRMKPTSHKINRDSFDSQKEVDKLKKNDDAGPWKDLIEYEVSDDYYKYANLRIGETQAQQSYESGIPMGMLQSVKRQRIQNAHSDELNLDYYSVTIQKLPGNMDMEAFFQLLRGNLDMFLEGAKATKGFDSINHRENEIWNSDKPHSAIMYFTALPLAGITEKIGEKMAVMATDYKVTSNAMTWIFTPVYADIMGVGFHPLAGNRQFGLVKNKDNTITFYTRGVDRPYSLLDAPFGGEIFRGAHELWTTMTTNVENYINENGGKAERNKNFISKRISWDKEHKKD